MSFFKSIWLASLCIGLAFIGKLQGQSTDSELNAMYENIEFKMPQVKQVSFKNNEVNIKDFGAVGDGVFKNTNAFKQSIEAVVKQGGGTVIVPAGMWLTGPITLKSHVNLHLESGAFIQFSKDFEDYPLLQTSFEGLNSVRSTSPLNAENATNIAITGSGVIDGNGGAWRPVKKGKMTANQWKSLLASGGVLTEDEKVWYPNQGALKGSKSDVQNMTLEELEAVRTYLRPVLLSFVGCKTVLLDGPTFQNSPAWNIHPLMCEDVTIRNLSIRNPWYSQNGDGLDLESCNRALVYNNTFDVGDDAICLKSGKNKDGRDRNIPTQNVIIKNNIVYHGHGGFVVGSEMSGGVKNVHISNCNFIGTDTGLRFKSTRGRGGIVENIYISDIYMTKIPNEAIRFNLYYGGKTPDLSESANRLNKTEATLVPVTEETPSFKDIYMKNIYVNQSAKAAFFMGLPEMNVKNVSITDAVFHTEQGITMIDVDGVTLNRVKVKATKDHALVVYNGKNIKVSDFSFDESQSAIKVLGTKTDDITFKASDFSNISEQVFISEEIEKKAVKFTK